MVPDEKKPLWELEAEATHKLNKPSLLSIILQPIVSNEDEVKESLEKYPDSYDYRKFSEADESSNIYNK